MLGKPKHGGKDEENLTHFFRHYLVMWFFVVILLLLSGLFTPTRSMPSLAYLTTYINPVSYFIEAMRTVFIRGGNFSSIIHQVFALLSIGMFMGSWAVISYKKNN